MGFDELVISSGLRVKSLGGAGMVAVIGYRISIFLIQIPLSPPFKKGVIRNSS